MVALICALLAAVALALLSFATTMLDGMFDVVFDVASQIPGTNWSNIVNSLTETIYTVAVYLMIIKCLIKIFNTYVLWNDGEEAEPIPMLINFIKAIVVAACFPYIYRYFVDITRDVMKMLESSITAYSGDDLSNMFSSVTASMGIGTLVVGIVFLVGIIVIYFSFMKRGMEVELMILGVPLACTGLLDNDKGIFKSYMNQMVKLIITTVFQLVVMRLGVSIGLSGSIWDGNITNMLWGVACLLLGISIPQILSEWMIASGGGGGMMTKMYTISMVGRAVKGIIK